MVTIIQHAPPCRLVLVTVIRNDDTPPGASHWIEPIVALRSTLYDDEAQYDEILYVTVADGIDTRPAARNDATGSCSRIVEAPWRPDEDEARLARVIAEMVKEALWEPAKEHARDLAEG